MKKKSASLLVFALAAALATGCRGQAGESSISSKDTGEGAGSVSADGSIAFPLPETEKFSMICGINNPTPIDQIDAFRYINEQSNIAFDVTSIPVEDVSEKAGLMIAAGDYPDAFVYSGLDAEKYGSQGVLIPLEDLIQSHAPNLTKFMDEKNLWQGITSADGHIYGMPQLKTGATLQDGFHVWLNRQWMDRLGLSEPKSLDELHDVLAAFKERDANGNGDLSDEIPLSVPDGLPYLRQFLPYFGYNLDLGTWLANQNGNLVYVPMDDGYKGFLRYFTKLYQEGLLDPSSFIQNYDQLASRGSSGDVLGCFSALASFQFAGRGNDEEYQILTPFEGQSVPQSSGVGSGAMLITDACKDPAVLVAWADQLYTQEGGTLCWLGVKDRSYLVNEDGTWSWNIGGPLGDDIATIRQKGTLLEQAAFPCIQPDFWSTGMTDPNESYLTSQRSKMLDYGESPLPFMSYSVEETESIASLKADLDSYINQYAAQVMTGAIDLDGSWEDYVSTMNAMGASELYKLYKKAFDQVKEK